MDEIHRGHDTVVHVKSAISSRIRALPLFWTILATPVFAGDLVQTFKLTELFGGRKVDFVEVDFLNPRMKRAALENAEEL